MDEHYPKIENLLVYINKAYASTPDWSIRFRPMGEEHVTSPDWSNSEPMREDHVT